MRRRLTATLAIALPSLALLLPACGASYVQPPIPTERAQGPTLALRPLTVFLSRGDASVDASGTMLFDAEVIGTFTEDGRFTLPNGFVWASLGDDGVIRVRRDHPSAPAETEEAFAMEGDRLLRPDGALFARIDPAGQIVTATGTHAVTGITSRTTRLALFLYLVSAFYEEDLAAAPGGASDEPAGEGEDAGGGAGSAVR